MKLLYVAGWTYIAISVVSVLRSLNGPQSIVEPSFPPAILQGQAGTWFQRVRPHCNPVEIEVTIRSNPVPSDFHGQAQAAACYALAGKIEQATGYIDGLPKDQRAQAADIVFNAAHPVADAGDDEATGPIMELVVKYYPTHYMALYHAGIAQFRTGQPAAAKRNLEAFLQHYNQNDGWTSSARNALEQIASGK